ncbi:RNA polymerase sigma factor [Nocardia wallacei]|uniref:RNA polymerase sigma factor n=1 Tax=Nocardia wallacei TaxID=480035 RepID=UPI002455AB18|nr:RNA polymerase sigma factor [Nocardia wallacei]
MKTAAVPSFDELLVQVMDSTHDTLLESVTRQVGSRADAEDIVQTALLRVYRAKPDIDEAAKLRAYLWAAATNLVRDSWRRSADTRRRCVTYDADRAVSLAACTQPCIDDMVALRHTLLAALCTLPPREREAVVLRAFHGNSYSETARIMGVSTGTVKGYVHDALARIRARLTM